MPVRSALIEARLDERSYRRALARLEKYEGRKFTKRMEAAFLAGTRLAVRPMRARAPRESGLLAKKVSTRKRRPPVGYFAYAGTKSRAPHAGLLAKGHRMVTRSGRVVGYVPGDPFVENTIDNYEGRIISFIKEATHAEGISAFGSITRF